MHRNTSINILSLVSRKSFYSVTYLSCGFKCLSFITMPSFNFLDTVLSVFSRTNFIPIFRISSSCNHFYVLLKNSRRMDFFFILIAFLVRYCITGVTPPVLNEECHCSGVFNVFFSFCVLEVNQHDCNNP